MCRQQLPDCGETKQPKGLRAFSKLREEGMEVGREIERLLHVFSFFKKRANQTPVSGMGTWVTSFKGQGGSVQSGVTFRGREGLWY